MSVTASDAINQLQVNGAISASGFKAALDWIANHPELPKTGHKYSILIRDLEKKLRLNFAFPVALPLEEAIAELRNSFRDLVVPEK